MVSLSLAGEEPVALPCDCRVTGLERLAGGAAFRLSDPGDGPLWLLDAAAFRRRASCSCRIHRLLPAGLPVP